MDLSRLKWPLIIIVVGLLGWLLTEGGTNWMYGRFTQTAPGTDAKLDEVNEQGLSQLGGFLFKTFRYAKAAEVFEEQMKRFPNGKNYMWTLFRMAKIDEKQGNPKEAVAKLQWLMQQKANEKDDRIPGKDMLQLRIDKLNEVNETGVVGGGR